MTVLTSVAELSARSGETVVFIGRPENSKAGPLLFDSDGQSVWCSGPHWPDELIGKRIQAVVRVTAATESSNLPVATQDAEGGWTQGVEAPQASKPSGSEPEGPAEVPSVVLKVLRHTLLR